MWPPIASLYQPLTTSRQLEPIHGELEITREPNSLRQAIGEELTWLITWWSSSYKPTLLSKPRYTYVDFIPHRGMQLDYYYLNYTTDTRITPRAPTPKFRQLQLLTKSTYHPKSTHHRTSRKLTKKKRKKEIKGKETQTSQPHTTVFVCFPATCSLGIPIIKREKYRRLASFFAFVQGHGARGKKKKATENGRSKGVTRIPWSLCCHIIAFLVLTLLFLLTISLLLSTGPTYFFFLLGRWREAARSAGCPPFDY